jgi:hypothetical protein
MKERPQPPKSDDADAADDDSLTTACKDIYEPEDYYFKNVDCSVLHRNVKSLECSVPFANNTDVYCVARVRSPLVFPSNFIIESRSLQGIDMCCEPNPLPAFLTGALSFTANIVLLLLVCRFCKKTALPSPSHHQNIIGMKRTQQHDHDPLLRGKTGFENV